ncbi:hypothetical protein [Gilvimarinus polysaccharolyticus]|uniref:hypothetical protein n=1 Tax=Gilvimarinus polysaccharolyticus TaxID=863921 RepID=UPI000673256E|nr:hypothetical protein [Gilvimarinus polysaccharolyticus]
MWLKRAANYLWQRNPITRVVYARADRGLKIIALSLILVFVSVLPYALAVLFDCAVSARVQLVWLFAIGAALAHVGFVVGLVLLIYDRLWMR